MVKQLLFYITPDGKVPVEDWIRHLRDQKARSIIRTRLDRLETGNPGDHKAVGKGVFELRIHFGPGYRLYYGEDGDRIIVLLMGGDKSTQERDIECSKSFWMDYKKL